MKRFLVLLATAGTLGSTALAATGTPCADCKVLEDIVQQYKKETSIDKPKYYELESKATRAVQKMTEKSKHLSDQQVTSFVDVMKISVPLDPGRSFVEDNLEVIMMNRAAIEKQTKTLPRKEADALLGAIEAFVSSAENGQDD